MYQYRQRTLDLLCAAIPDLGYQTGSQEAIFYNYLTARYDGELIGFPLAYSTGNMIDPQTGSPIGVTTSRYVTGYLATLYLSSMAAESMGAGPAITTQDGKTSVSSTVIRSGLNSILERMHNGETFDQVIADISKDASGTSRYTSSDDFEARFICGSAVQINGQNAYSGDSSSLAFVAQFLNYMQAMNTDPNRTYGANGSLLFDFDRDFAGPLDNTKNETSDVYNITDKNTAVESTVPNSTALATGGKSQSGKTSSAQAEAASAQGVADKTQTESAPDNSADTSASTANPIQSTSVATTTDDGEAESSAATTTTSEVEDADVDATTAGVSAAQECTPTAAATSETASDELPAAAKAVAANADETSSSTQDDALTETV